MIQRSDDKSRIQREAGEDVERWLLPPSRTLKDAMEAPTPLPPVVIEGLMYQKEVHKIVSDSKAKKTWLAMMISITVAKGWKLFDRWQCQQSRVLHLDAELLQGGLEDRFATIARKMLIDPDDTFDDNGEPLIDIRGLRDHPATVDDLVHALPLTFEPGEYGLIVLDSLYRFYGEDEDENSNPKQTELFAKLTRLAGLMNCGILVVHHTSKGNQANKKVQDVGSGAGAQSRFADGLLVVREHENEGCAVLEGLTRHHVDPKPITIKWEYPMWIAKDGIDPIVKQIKGKQTKEREQNDLTDINFFLQEFPSGKPFNAGDIRKTVGTNADRSVKLLKMMIIDEMIVPHSEFERRKNKPSKHYTTDLSWEFNEEFDLEDYTKWGKE